MHSHPTMTSVYHRHSRRVSTKVGESFSGPQNGWLPLGFPSTLQNERMPSKTTLPNGSQPRVHLLRLNDAVVPGLHVFLRLRPNRDVLPWVEAAHGLAIRGCKDELGDLMRLHILFRHLELALPSPAAWLRFCLGGQQIISAGISSRVLPNQEPSVI